MPLKINAIGKYQGLNGMNLNQILRSARVQQPFIYEVILQRKWKYLGLFVNEARAFATADMPLGNWKKLCKMRWLEELLHWTSGKRKTFMIYLWFNNVRIKIEKRKIAGTFFQPSDNTIKIKFIFIIYLYSEKGIPHGIFSVVSTVL